MSSQKKGQFWGDVNPYRWELTNKIAGVLRANGENLRPVSYAAEIPAGGLSQLIYERPFDAVRAEMGGTTVTVEITPERQGEQPSSDDVRFACYDFATFRDWFYDLLRRSGQEPRPSEQFEFAKGQPIASRTHTPRADLRSAPMIRHKNKGRR